MGATLIVWGLAGPYLSDMLGNKMGYKATEADKEALEKLKPRLHVVDRDDNKR